MKYDLSTETIFQDSNSPAVSARVSICAVVQVPSLSSRLSTVLDHALTTASCEGGLGLAGGYFCTSCPDIIFHNKTLMCIELTVGPTIYGNIPVVKPHFVFQISFMQTYYVHQELTRLLTGLTFSSGAANKMAPIFDRFCHVLVFYIICQSRKTPLLIEVILVVI